MFNEYLKWLLDKVNFDGLVGLRGGGFPANLTYNNLLYFLFCKDFKYLIERDENRMRDALSLRYEFYEDFGQETSGEVASVLEVLVALAVRLDQEYVGDPDDPHPEIIFWSMIRNLGLNAFDDSRWNELKADQIVDIWLLREYDFNGKGGIFPLSVATFDQKNVEIWDQAMAYISENE